ADRNLHLITFKGFSTPGFADNQSWSVLRPISFEFLHFLLQPNRSLSRSQHLRCSSNREAFSLEGEEIRCGPRICRLPLDNQRALVVFRRPNPSGARLEKGTVVWQATFG